MDTLREQALALEVQYEYGANDTTARWEADRPQLLDTIQALSQTRDLMRKVFNHPHALTGSRFSYLSFPSPGWHTASIVGWFYQMHSASDAAYSNVAFGSSTDRVFVYAKLHCQVAMETTTCSCMLRAVCLA